MIFQRIVHSLGIWFLESNKDYQEYLQFQEEQGSDELVIAMIPTEDALGESHVAKLRELHQKIDSLPYVDTSFSLANAKYPMPMQNIRFIPIEKSFTEAFIKPIESGKISKKYWTTCPP